MVLNGSEIGGGSGEQFTPKLQSLVFGFAGYLG